MSLRDTLLAQIGKVDAIIAIAPEPREFANELTLISLRRHRRELMQELQQLPTEEEQP